MQYKIQVQAAGQGEKALWGACGLDAHLRRDFSDRLAPTPPMGLLIILSRFRIFRGSFPVQQGGICPPSDRNCARNGLRPGVSGTCGQRSLRRLRSSPTPSTDFALSCWPFRRPNTTSGSAPRRAAHRPDLSQDCPARPPGEPPRQASRPDSPIQPHQRRQCQSCHEATPQRGNEELP